MGDEIRLYNAIGQGGQLSGFDMQLLEMAADRLTGEEMWEKLGEPDALSPARCIQRVKEIVRAQDYLSRHEQKALLLLDFIKLRDALWERIDDGNESRITKNGDVVDVGLGASYYNALTRVLKEWRTTIESMAKDVDNEEVSIRQVYADAMMAAISVMFDRFMGRLEKHFALYKELPDAADARTMFEEVMPLGFTAIGAQKDAA